MQKQTDTSTDLALVHKPCDLCGSNNEEFLFERPGALSRILFRLVRCANCGLLYFNPRLSAEGTAALYNERYYAGEGFDPSVQYLAEWNAPDEAKKFRPDVTVNFIEELQRPPARWLDYGCGIGDLVRQARKRGYDAEGFEVSEYAMEFGRAQGLQVFASAAELPHNTYDVVTAIEVLEHTFSPTETLTQIYSCLRPGGVFYYTTGNFDGFYENWRRGKVDPQADAYISPEGHINFFSSEVMRRYFAKIGFSQIFEFEPESYTKTNRTFLMLDRYGLIEGTATAPRRLWDKLVYRSAQRVSTLLFGRRPLNVLARK